MAPRVSGDALLVGSLPTESTERAFRDGGELFGDLTFALPDGESGPRGAWVAHDRVALLEPHPDVEVVAPSPAPDRRARHAYDTARPTVREGVSGLRFDRWPRIDEALASYARFTEPGPVGDAARAQRGAARRPRGRSAEVRDRSARGGRAAVDVNRV